MRKSQDGNLPAPLGIDQPMFTRVLLKVIVNCSGGSHIDFTFDKIRANQKLDPVNMNNKDSLGEQYA